MSHEMEAWNNPLRHDFPSIEDLLKDENLKRQMNREKVKIVEYERNDGRKYFTIEFAVYEGSIGNKHYYNDERYPYTGEYSTFEEALRAIHFRWRGDVKSSRKVYP